MTGKRFSLIARGDDTELWEARDTVRVAADTAHPEITVLRDALTGFRERPRPFAEPASAPPPLDDDTRERLKALGYVE